VIYGIEMGCLVYKVDHNNTNTVSAKRVRLCAPCGREMSSFYSRCLSVQRLFYSITNM